MSPSQPQQSEADASSTSTAPAELMRLRAFTGSYYRVLGWIDLISSVISLAIVYWTGHVAITFGFILWFWLGNGLKQGSSSARKWALSSSFVMMILLVIGLILPRISLKLAPWGIDYTHSAFLPLAGIALVVLAVPTVLLLGKNGRRAFTTNEEGEQD
jgi:hypothetical protein